MTDSISQQPSTVLRIERTFNAPARAVFDAWTSPEVMARWWHAGSDWETPVAEVDLRVGGSLRVTMRAPNGDEYGARGEYTEIQPPERLVFTWTWDDSDGQASLIELDFTEQDAATTVVLTHSGLSGEESKLSHTEGWNKVLDSLGRTLEA
jgi:uncharacterized protein YndB with AHSA1/START domain